MKTKREIIEGHIYVEHGKVECFVDVIEVVMQEYAEQQTKELLLDFEAWKDQNTYHLGYEIDDIVDWYFELNSSENPNT